MPNNDMIKLICSNIVSGISVCALIVFAVMYINFKHSPVYESYAINIVNNPVAMHENIEFEMTGKKILNCTATNVFAEATRHGKTVILDTFAKTYTRNPPVSVVGEFFTNKWALVLDKKLSPGVWSVNMEATWHCRKFIFSNVRPYQIHDNILLMVR